MVYGGYLVPTMSTLVTPDVQVILHNTKANSASSVDPMFYTHQKVSHQWLREDPFCALCQTLGTSGTFLPAVKPVYPQDK